LNRRESIHAAKRPATGIQPVARTALNKLEAVVLLAGSVRPTPLHQAIGRNVLDLPIDATGSILGHWQRQIDRLAAMLGRPFLEVKVMIDRAADVPASASPAASGRAVVNIERDPLDLRGTGGVLHDLAKRWDDDRYILVASAGQIMLEPIVDIAQSLADLGGDVTVVSHRDGTPSGMMLVRCSALRDIAPVGFVDMKEQALPRIARDHDVVVFHNPTATGLPVRTLADYIDALRIYHRRLQGASVPVRGDDNDWRLTFALVEEAAHVHPQARIHDSVVLAGARVQRDAVVVRSIVGPDAIVTADSMIVDQALGAKA
jgi:mannose-1-phosphate guanylyltransferase